MAYAPRRRAGKEVQAFATAFAQGMKLFSDDDRGGRARARDPYSDENIAKRDERLGSTGALGKLFGMGKDELTGFDRGRAAIEEKMRIAAERGDASAYEKFAKERVLLEKQATTPAVGETWKQSPFENRSAPKTETDAPLPIPRPGAALDVGGQDTVASSGGENDLVAYNDPTGGSADWSNMFSGENSIFSARGGMVPMLHAARGMSVPSRTGDTHEYGYIDDPNDEGFGAVQGPENDPIAPPGTPSVEDDERGDHTANLGLSRDPEELASAAAPAIAAGMDRIQSELKPTGAISAQDPTYQDKLQKFARGEGRMSDEEISQMDAAIDPDGTMSPGSRSAARVAAIYKFYQDKGDPQTAQDMAARVVLYDKFASQTRGAMALQAFKDGDTESGVRLLEDAYNNNMPDGKTLKTKINNDGTVDFQIGWDKLTGFKTSQEGKATQQDLIQLASNTATGTEQMQRFMQAAGISKGDGGGKKAAGAAAPDSKALQSAIDTYRKAESALNALPDDASPEDRKKAFDTAQSAYDAARNAVPVGKGKGVPSQIWALNNAGIKPPNVPGATPARAGGATGGTKEERAEAAEQAQLRGLREQAALYPETTPTEFPDDRVNALRRDAQSNLAEMGVGRAAQNKKSAALEPDARAKPLIDALIGETQDDENGKPVIDPKTKQPIRTGGLLNEEIITKSGKTDEATKPRQMSRSEQFALTDIFARIAPANNQVSNRTLAETVYRMAFERNGPRPQVDPRDGAVIFDGRKVFIDKQSMTEIAALRQAELGRLAGMDTKKARAEGVKTLASEAEDKRVAEEEAKKKKSLQALPGASGAQDRLRALEQFQLNYDRFFGGSAR